MEDYYRIWYNTRYGCAQICELTKPCEKKYRLYVTFQSTCGNNSDADRTHWLNINEVGQLYEPNDSTIATGSNNYHFDGTNWHFTVDGTQRTIAGNIDCITSIIEPNSELWSFKTEIKDCQ